MTKYEPGRFDHAVVQEKAKELLDLIEEQVAGDIRWQIGVRWVDEKSAWRETKREMEMFNQWLFEQASNRLIAAEQARKKEARGE